MWSKRGRGAGGKRSRLSFSAGDSEGPDRRARHSLLKKPEPIKVDFLVHRDRKANAAVIEIAAAHPPEGRALERWTKLSFKLAAPVSVLNQSAAGICRFTFRRWRPTFAVHDTAQHRPRRPRRCSSRAALLHQDVSKKRGLFYTPAFRRTTSADQRRVRG